MKVIICVDYSPYTEKVLQAAKFLLGIRIPQPEITVIHIIDITLLSGAPGNELSVTGHLLGRREKDI